MMDNSTGTPVPPLHFRLHWSEDAAQDLKALWGADVMAEMGAAFLEEGMVAAYAHLKKVAMDLGVPEEVLEQWREQHRIPPV
jgi:hypothetical protein